MLTELDALGLDLEAIERPKAKERKREHGGTAPGRKRNTGGKFPPVKQKTRDAVGAAVGLSGKSYERAKAVVDSGDAKIKLGELLAATERAKGAAQRGYRALPRANEPEPTLADLGLSKRESAQANMLAEPVTASVAAA